MKNEEINSVQRYITMTNERERSVLNELMECGRISDNCVWAYEVAEADGQFIWAALFPPREFAMTRRGEWVTDPYQPWERSQPRNF